MPSQTRLFVAVILPLIFAPLIAAQSAIKSTPMPMPKNTVLPATDIGPNLFPDKVFFAGKVAPVQFRNTGGVHFADGTYILAGLVDNAGYSGGVQEKYQGYLLTEAPVEIDGQILKPGAYGFGFLKDGKFLVLDLGARALLETASKHDSMIKRPRPLEVTAEAKSAGFRLYVGREYVEFHHAR